MANSATDRSSTSDASRLLGEWVTARCRKRAEEHGKALPDEVRVWLAGSPCLNVAAVKPTPAVLVWLFKTIDDPDWPRP